MSVVHYVRDVRSGARHRPFRHRHYRGHRTARWAAALTGASLLLAGCGTVPGAGVVVDGTRISEQTVQNRAQAYIDENAPDSTQVPDVTRALINQFQATDVVRHQLVLAAAKAERITITDQKINSFISQNDGAASIGNGLEVPKDAVHDAVYDYLVLEQLVAKIPAAGVDVTDISITVDVVPADDRDAAVAARSKYLNDPAAMDAAAAAARATNSQLPGGEESLLTNAQDASVGIFSVPEGQIVLIPSSDGYYVVRVTKRTEKPAKLTKQALQTATSAGISAYLPLASLLLGKYAAAKDVTVNPRFGQWDPETLQVVAANNGL